MKDPPLFDADDTTTSYSPPRADRPRWVEQQWGNAATTGPSTSQATPQHWFDPSGGPASAPTPPPSPPAAPRPPRNDGPGPSRSALVAGAAGLAFVAAGLASGGTFALLAMGGYLD
ncbi:MAG: hypothetical protein LH650_03275, partial [Chloroflexi bacterium]|nr:hypothetical protein [Chloroflexota bacterium]